MLIETYGLTKKYGKKLALNKVNLKIDRGQLVAYLGTNGAGKSTTINILTGLLKPTSGTIKYAPNLKIGVLYKNVCKLTKGLKASSEIIPLISRRNIHHLDIHNPCVSQF